MSSLNVSLGNDQKFAPCMRGNAEAVRKIPACLLLHRMLRSCSSSLSYCLQHPDMQNLGNPDSIQVVKFPRKQTARRANPNWRHPGTTSRQTSRKVHWGPGLSQPSTSTDIVPPSNTVDKSTKPVNQEESSMMQLDVPQSPSTPLSSLLLAPELASNGHATESRLDTLIKATTGSHLADMQSELPSIVELLEAQAVDRVATGDAFMRSIPESLDSGEDPLHTLQRIRSAYKLILEEDRRKTKAWLAGVSGKRWQILEETGMALKLSTGECLVSAEIL